MSYSKSWLLSLAYFLILAADQELTSSLIAFIVGLWKQVIWHRLSTASS